MNEINEMLHEMFWKSSQAPGLWKYLCNILWSLSKTLEYLVVILQVDVGKHICCHFISFGEVYLQAILIHLTLKLCDDGSWFNEADTAQMQIQYTYNYNLNVGVKAFKTHENLEITAAIYYHEQENWALINL